MEHTNPKQTDCIESVDSLGASADLSGRNIRRGLELLAGRTVPAGSVERVLEDSDTFAELALALNIGRDTGDLAQTGLYYWAGSRDVDIGLVDAAIALWFPDELDPDGLDADRLAGVRQTYDGIRTSLWARTRTEALN